MKEHCRKFAPIFTFGVVFLLFLSACGGSATPTSAVPSSSGSAPTTPIKHVVVIFQENVSFDHYFATYPNATNPVGEPAFNPLPALFGTTPSVNGLSGPLLTNNPNSA